VGQLLAGGKQYEENEEKLEKKENAKWVVERSMRLRGGGE
jgi:hypothetical protein